MMDSLETNETTALEQSSEITNEQQVEQTAEAVEQAEPVVETSEPVAEETKPEVEETAETARNLIS